MDDALLKIFVRVSTSLSVTANYKYRKLYGGYRFILKFITSSGLSNPRKLAMIAGVPHIPSKANFAELVLHDGFHYPPCHQPPNSLLSTERQPTFISLTIPLSTFPLSLSASTSISAWLSFFSPLRFRGFSVFWYAPTWVSRYWV